MSSPSSSSTAAIIAATAIAAACTASVLTAKICTRRRAEENDTRIAKLEETRRAERTGRIRAEVKLRTALKERESEESRSTVADDEVDSSQGSAQVQQNHHNLQLQCIGTIVSPYTKRMGTPRQGALVPSGRGYIQLRIPVECVEGLECYSHIWILFTFHANTDISSTKKNNSGSKKSNSKGNKSGSKNKNAGGFIMNLSKTKIRPPRGNGIKVGMLATRSPHRPNNIGLSLCKVERVDKKLKQLHIAALDLVNGTPVYDVKPCVPWDVPGYFDKMPLVVPEWVSQDDELEFVKFSSRAEEALEQFVAEGKLAPLYTTANGGLEGARKTICEILAQDPRASNSNGPNKRGTNSSASGSNTQKKNDTYKMILCMVEIEFRVGESGVIVDNICGDLDLEGVEHVDGIPLLLKNGT